MLNEILNAIKDIYYAIPGNLDQLYVALKQYFPYIPPALLAFGITFLSTPLIGKFAKKFGFIDLPADKRKENC